jgi:hypothetical protein
VEEQILTALKTKYKNLGFGDKALAGVAAYLATTVKEETGIEPAITGAEPLLKAFQSDIDTRVTNAIKAAKDEQKKQEQKPEPEQKPEDHKDEPPAWAKGILDRLDAFEKKESRASLISKAREKLAEKHIPETFLRGRSLDIETEADIDKLVNTVETDFTAFRQDLVNQGVIVSTPTEGGGDKADAAVAKMIAEKRNNPTIAQGVVGKKLI